MGYAMFEYKFMPAPKQVRKGTAVVNDAHALTRRLDSEINLVTGSGWEFVRAEKVPVKERWLFIPVTRQRDYLIFRRPISAAEEPRIPEAVTPLVRPRRVRPRRVVPNERPGDIVVA